MDDNPRAELAAHLVAAARELEPAAELLQQDPDALGMRYGEREVARTYLSQTLTALITLQRWIGEGR